MAFMPGVLATVVKVGACALGDARSPSRTAWHSAQTLCAKRSPSLTFPLSSASAELANALTVNPRKVFNTADFIRFLHHSTAKLRTQEFDTLHTTITNSTHQFCIPVDPYQRDLASVPN